MHDSVLARLRATASRLGQGSVDQARSAGQLFAGDYSTATTAGREFGGSRLGVGVMDGLDGEIISIHGRTWRVPVDGVPILVGPDEGIAFGVAAHGGRHHALGLESGLDVTGILNAIDAYLERTHVDHEQVVCAVEIAGSFTDVLLRTVAPPTRVGETLGEIIDEETRFAFPEWEGTLVGFRFPDASSGSTIPGLHLHGLGADTTTGGHLRNATTKDVHARIWVDHLHQTVDDGPAKEGADTDFARYEGPTQ